MEPLCKFVDENIRVNLEDEEMQDIQKAVDIMVKRFVKALHEINPEIKIDRLEFCGSMAEDTRIWVPGSSKCDLEFDYLVVIKSWPGCGEFEPIPSNKEGMMQIKYRVIDPQSVNGKKMNLNTAIKQSFINTVLNGIRAKCEQNVCTRQVNKFPDVHGCQCCTIYMETGNLRSTDVPVVPMSSGNVEEEWVLSFVWSSIKRSVCNPFRITKLENSSPDPSAVDMLQINVDFNPVIELNQTMLKPNEDGTKVRLEESQSYLLFPYFKIINTFDWRISTCNRELKPLRECSKEHKLAFCVLKFIGKAFRSYGNIEYFGSYEAKCIVLNHIKSCQAQNRGAHLCLLDMINDIYECSGNDSLPHPVLPTCNVYNMVPKSVFDILEPQLKAIRCKVLCSLFQQSDHVSLEELFFDIECISKLYEKYKRTPDNKLFADFLQRRREASAKDVFREEVDVNVDMFIPTEIKKLIGKVATK